MQDEWEDHKHQGRPEHTQEIAPGKQSRASSPRPSAGFGPNAQLRFANTRTRASGSAGRLRTDEAESDTRADRARARRIASALVSTGSAASGSYAVSSRRTPGR